MLKNFDPKLPYQNFLSIKKFKKQLKFFKDKYGLISNKRKYLMKIKNILTFDDGLKHHYEIAKFLNKKKILGIFFYMYKTVNR